MKSRMKNYPTSLSRPIDSTAARVVSKGTSHEFKSKPFSVNLWDTPPPIVRLPHGWKNYAGQRHGNLVLIGLYDASTHKLGANWLARCDCGMFTTRRILKWRESERKGKKGDKCQKCIIQADRIRKYDREKHFERTGQWPKND